MILYESSQAVDHMDPLVAILRSNFLLSTHVITIVLGYAAGLLAAVLSHIYLLASPLCLISGKTEQSLDRMAYGILCFSLVFTLVGGQFLRVWGQWSRGVSGAGMQGKRSVDDCTVAIDRIACPESPDGCLPGCSTSAM